MGLSLGPHSVRRIVVQWSTGGDPLPAPPTMILQILRRLESLAEGKNGVSSLSVHKFHRQHWIAVINHVL